VGEEGYYLLTLVEFLIRDDMSGRMRMQVYAQKRNHCNDAQCCCVFWGEQFTHIPSGSAGKMDCEEE
jgi:hypothetical protein